MVFENIYEDLVYFTNLSFQPSVLWEIIPLAIATVLIILYSEKYKEERYNWSSYLSNSLVLIFVSLALFKHIFNIGLQGFQNFVDYTGKTSTAAFVLLIGLILLRFNFERVLPEKITRYLSSTLSVNLTAYAIILFVHSDLKITTTSETFRIFISLLLLIVFLYVVFNFLRAPLHKLFKYIENEKIKEEIKNIKEAEYKINELEKELEYRIKSLKKDKLKELEKRRKNNLKIKKAIKKIK